MSVNKVILLGRLGKDPEMRMTASQMPVTRFSLATSERRKDQSGEWKEQTEWHNIVVFGKTAENCQKFLKKGREVFIDGRIQTNKWQDKEGKDRYTTEIIAGTVKFIGSGSGRGASEGGAESFSSEESSAGRDLMASLPTAESLASADKVPFDDDDIPF